MVHATRTLTAQSIYSAQSGQGSGRNKQEFATKRSKQAEKNGREQPLIEPVSGRRVKRSTFFIFLVVVVVVVDPANMISNTHTHTHTQERVCKRVFSSSRHFYHGTERLKRRRNLLADYKSGLAGLVSLVSRKK